MMRKTFKVLFFVKRTKKLKNGDLPVYARITVNGERTEFGIQMTVQELNWDMTKGRANSKSKQGKELNNYLNTVTTNLLVKKRELEDAGELVTAESLRKAYLGLTDDQKTLLNIFRDHNARCRDLVGIDFAKGTAVKYESCYRQLQKYIVSTGKKDVLLSEVNQYFLKEFETYLKIYGGCGHNSAVKYVANLKKIIRIALINGWMKKDPFVNYTLKLNEVDVAYLTEDELKAMMQKTFKIQRIDQVKDVYLFCCFTGLAFSDVKSLCDKDIVMVGDQKWIQKRRQKTSNLFKVPLIEPALRILKKYENHPECKHKGVLLPVLSNQKMNAYLKEIADLMQIGKNLSTHTARHTFATTVTLTNQVSIEVISKMLGHSSINMTQKYARVVDDLIKKDMLKVKVKFEPELVSEN
jgi:site-specific recombinase XerD